MATHAKCESRALVRPQQMLARVIQILADRIIVDHNLPKVAITIGFGFFLLLDWKPQPLRRVCFRHLVELAVSKSELPETYKERTNELIWQKRHPSLRYQARVWSNLADSIRVLLDSGSAHGLRDLDEGTHSGGLEHLGDSHFLVDRMGNHYALNASSPSFANQ